jgi:prolyl oligopeptidase
MAANGPGAAADSGSPGAAATAEAADPLQWLEDVHGERAMAWVKTENDKTLAVLERDPRFSAMYGQALAISEARDRIPYPDFNRHAIFNFWQDEQHSRGLWRRTTLESYRSPAPHWTSVLNLDALAASESANWVWEGADCLRPVQQRCLVSLSDGGEDAVTVREFDLATLQFVSDGFVLPTSKQDATWIDADHLLVSRDWGPGTLTASGYPYVVKALARGEDISKAQEVFRGQPDDVGVVAWGLEDGAGHRVTLITRYLSFFESEVYVVGANGPKRLNIPKKASVDALVANRLLITLKEP